MNKLFKMNVADGIHRLHQAAEEIEAEYQLNYCWETQILDAFKAGVYECECAINEGCDSTTLVQMIDNITQRKPFAEAETELRALAQKLIK